MQADEARRVAADAIDDRVRQLILNIQGFSLCDRWELYLDYNGVRLAPFFRDTYTSTTQWVSPFMESAAERVEMRRIRTMS
jgi:hypothetical protein